MNIFTPNSNVVQVATKPAATLVDGTTVFTVTGGTIQITQIGAICVTPNDATATTIQWQADGNDGAPTTITGASASLANAAAGTIVHSDAGTLATAPAVHSDGVGIISSGSILVPAGAIKIVVGVGSSTGTWQHFIQYRSLVPGATVS